MSHTAAFDAAMAELPGDWDRAELYVTLDDPGRLNEARVLLARANARPQRADRLDCDFEITVAHTHGHGAYPGVVHTALAALDAQGITGHTWLGGTASTMRPAPAHRYGP